MVYFSTKNIVARRSRFANHSQGHSTGLLIPLFPAAWELRKWEMKCRHNWRWKSGMTVYLLTGMSAYFVTCQAVGETG